MSSRVSTTVAAPVRTAAQLGVGYVLVEFVAAFFAPDWSERQYLAALGLATLVVTALQHLVENRTGRAVLRDVPPTTAPLVEGDPGRARVDVLVQAVLWCVLLTSMAVLVAAWLR